MNILVLGSGGREHALAWKIAQDQKVAKIFVAPGNAGTATEDKCENVDLDILNNPAIIDFAKANDVALVVVGAKLRNHRTVLGYDRLVLWPCTNRMTGSVSISP